MLTFIYYVSVFYCSIFFLSILEKYNKGEIRDGDDLKIFMATKTFEILKKMMEAKKKVDGSLQRCLENVRPASDSDFEDSDESDSDDDDSEYKVHIFSNNDKLTLKMIIQEENTSVSGKISSLDGENMKLYVEKDNFFKEIIDVNIDNLINKDDEEFENLVKKMENFINSDFMTDPKLFLNVELINGKLRNSESIDLTKELQKYYVDGNRILSKNFIARLLKFNHNMELNDDYSVNIMTNDVEMFTLVNNQDIVISSVSDDDSRKLTYEVSKINK